MENEITLEQKAAMEEIKRMQLASGNPRFLRKIWDEDASIRAEFGGDFDSYLAFKKNEDRIHIVGRKGRNNAD